MKHSTPESMKFRKLQRRLGVSKAVTVGILELLWIATQNNARRGDIGRYSDEEIAIECDWDGDPEVLISALVETGWLDRSDEFRLVVHDWKQHAPRYVHAWIKSQNTTFATGGTTVTTTVETIEATTVATTEGGNQTKPNQTKPTLSLSGHLADKKFAENWSRWRSHLMAEGKPLNDISEEQQLYDLARFPTEEAIDIVKFSISRGARNLITNGDHKQEARGSPQRPASKFETAGEKYQRMRLT